MVRDRLLLRLGDGHTPVEREVPLVEPEVVGREEGTGPLLPHAGGDGRQGVPRDEHRFVPIAPGGWLR